MCQNNKKECGSCQGLYANMSDLTEKVLDKLNLLEEGHKKIFVEFSNMKKERDKALAELRKANVGQRRWAFSSFILLMLLIVMTSILFYSLWSC